jgi:hypothetical protein
VQQRLVKSGWAVGETRPYYWLLLGYTLPIGYGAGIYEWSAVYSGDSGNNSVSTVFGAEPVVVGNPVPEPSFLILPTMLLVGVGCEALRREWSGRAYCAVFVVL